MLSTSRGLSRNACSISSRLSFTTRNREMASIIARAIFIDSGRGAQGATRGQTPARMPSAAPGLLAPFRFSGQVDQTVESIPLQGCCRLHTRLARKRVRLFRSTLRAAFHAQFANDRKRLGARVPLAGLRIAVDYPPPFIGSIRPPGVHNYFVVAHR